MSNGLILPIKTEVLQVEDASKVSRVTRVDFPDGFSSVELHVDFTEEPRHDPYQDFLVTGPDGQINSALDERRPFTNRLGALLTAYHAEHGDFPDAFKS